MSAALEPGWQKRQIDAADRELATWPLERLSHHAFPWPRKGRECMACVRMRRRGDRDFVQRWVREAEQESAP